MIRIKIPQKALVKLLEQKDRYESFYSTAYNLEPDLKESPGCLRDFQTALWILQHCFDLKSIKEIKSSKEFGDNTHALSHGGALSSPTRFVHIGGAVSPSYTNTLSYVQIMTTGDAIDFGDLLQAQEGANGSSNGHGGLG